MNRSMELLWLLAVFLVPLAFLAQDFAKSETVIAYVEVPKVALPRTLVGLMVVLWLISWGLHGSVESGTSIKLKNLRPLPTQRLAWLGNAIRRQPHRWLPIAVGFYLGTTILSTALSGSFRVSLWGEVPGQVSYSTYTVVAYVILFSIIANRLKTRPQVWRLLATIVAMSVVVSGYAVLQHYGHDLLHLSESTGGVTKSFMGNSIFAAAVIMMTIPITVGASVTSLLNFPRRADSVGSNGSRWAVGSAIWGFWVVVLAIQFLGLLFTFSRGPWIGSLCALTLMMVLVAVFVGRRGFVRLVLVLGLATIITAAVFFNPRPVDPMTTDGVTTSINVVVDPAAAEVVDQFSSIGGEVLGGFSGGRLTHWQVSWQLIKNHPWFAFDSLSLRWLRPLVGYGPDLFRSTYLLKSSAQGPDRSLLAPDHAHNFFVHQAVEQGLLGGMSSFGIFAAALLAGAHQLLRSKNNIDTAHKLVLAALLSMLAGMAPGSWGLRNNLASALIQQGKPDGALKPLRESLEITEGTKVSIDALIIRAGAYVNLGRYQDAIVDLNQALKLKPSSAEAHAGMAVAYAHLGQEEKARKESDWAVESGADRGVMEKAIEEIIQGR